MRVHASEFCIIPSADNRMYGSSFERLRERSLRVCSHTFRARLLPNHQKLRDKKYDARISTYFDLYRVTAVDPHARADEILSCSQSRRRVERAASTNPKTVSVLRLPSHRPNNSAVPRKRGTNLGYGDGLTGP